MGIDMVLAIQSAYLELALTDRFTSVSLEETEDYRLMVIQEETGTLPNE